VPLTAFYLCRWREQFDEEFRISTKHFGVFCVYCFKGVCMTRNFSSTVDPAMDSGSRQDEPPTSRYVRFGPFHIDQQRQQVYRSGTRLRLQGKVYQVLSVLLQKQGEVVTREELKQALWPADTHVNYDANVNTTVNKLRQALGESTEKPLYIETIPRKGYSFISTAEFSDVPFPSQANSADLAKTGPEPALGTHQNTAPQSNRWLTIIVVGLVLAGMLLGAGAATYWLSHFAPQLRHSASKNAACVPASNAC
jgi:DNA-binding winged helix-turn-helix (wHTH) protein